LTWTGFGVVAFCAAIFLSIWVFGLREKWASEETASAYSVFNKDGKAIAGGFTAQQFDRQMRGGIRGSDDNDNAVFGSIAVAKTGNDNMRESNLSDRERIRRRKSAAAAAERRSQQTQG
jgi:hypothetical protein